MGFANGKVSLAAGDACFDYGALYGTLSKTWGERPLGFDDSQYISAYRHLGQLFDIRRLRTALPCNSGVKDIQLYYKVGRATGSETRNHS